jgi:hypothetical protein
MTTSITLNMTTTLQVLYRGPLESCNYGCIYCPFAKRKESAAQSREDRMALRRFVDWCAHFPDRNRSVGDDRVRLEVLFTPWGEGLHRRRYQRALTDLAKMDHVDFVGIQTNLSVAPRFDTTDLGENRSQQALLQKIVLWATWHPSQTSLRRFVDRLVKARDMGVRVSPGMVAVNEHLSLVDEFERELTKAGLRLEWLNAYKQGFRTPKGYYSADQVERLSRIDPMFCSDLVGERSSGKPCATGTTVIAVDGSGDVTRCHFVMKPLGNLYTDPLSDVICPPDTFRPCQRSECNCFQGYVHLKTSRTNALYPGQAALGRLRTS